MPLSNFSFILLLDKRLSGHTIAHGLCHFYLLSLTKIGISFRGGRRNKRSRKPEPRRLHRINKEIRAEEVRLVDAEGEPLGVVKTSQALSMAQEREVDLVEISPKAVPPVCKLIEYGKMLYALQKKEKASKLATKKNDIKGIRLTFRMGDGDLERQKKHAHDFLSTNHPVRVQLVMRGREKAHGNIAIEKMEAFIKDLEAVGTVDQTPKRSGFQIISLLKPKK